MIARVSVVADASAVAAVLFNEPEAEKITQRLTGVDLVAPSLLPYEIASACLKKRKRYPARAAALREAMVFLDHLPITLIDVSAENALDLAEEEGLTPYDAAYLWLARKLEIDLVTLDERLDTVATKSKRR